MIYSIVLTPWTEEDIIDAANWYSLEQPDLGLKFSKAVYEKLLIVKSNPFLFQLRGKNIRAAFLKQFPYGIYYTIENERVIVHAVLHAKRNPRISQERAKR
jgi:toxin ParE1/3/4